MEEGRTVHHDEMIGAIEAHTEHFNAAANAGKWMSAIWRLEGGQVKLCLTTWKFETGDFDTALNLLRDQLREFARNASDTKPSEPVGPEEILSLQQKMKEEQERHRLAVEAQYEQTKRVMDAGRATDDSDQRKTGEDGEEQ
jgi:hypothetical protein